MLPPKRVNLVRWLLTVDKLSCRKIARKTGVSRATVGLIAAGRNRKPFTPPQPWQIDPAQPLEPPQRCPDCGGWVRLPCRLCRVRRWIKKQREKRIVSGMSLLRQAGPLGLALRPGEQQRYEEVRRRRKTLRLTEEELHRREEEEMKNEELLRCATAEKTLLENLS
jgi:hypothetical protein